MRILITAAMLSALALSSASAATNRSTAGSGHGTAEVLYAASLENLMNTRLGPAFEKATGDSFSGYPAGSKELASDIKGKVRRGDVFISASPKVDATLRGAANGDWVS